MFGNLEKGKMKYYKSAAKYAGKVAGTSMVLVGSALAAVPVEVTTALTDAKADAITVAGSVIAIVVAIAAFLFMRKAIR